MMGRTHMLLGGASLWLLRPLPQVLTPEDLVPMLVLATFGALLPDLDAAGSTLKYWRIGGVQPFVPLAQLLHGRFGHRGALHSLRGLGVLALIGLPLLFWLPWRCIWRCWWVMPVICWETPAPKPAFLCSIRDRSVSGCCRAAGD